MPRKSIFPINERRKKLVSIHKVLDDKLRKYCDANKITAAEVINTLLAEKLAPSMLQDFRSYKQQPLTYPNRKRN